MRIRIFKTEIIVTFWFSLIIAFMLFSDRTGLVIPLFLAVFIHEIAHLAAMFLKKKHPKQIILIPGGINIINDSFCSVNDDNFILLSGPLANIIFFAVFYILFCFFNARQLLVFSIVQLIIGCINLLPAKGLDGGSIVYNLAIKRFSVSFSELLQKITTLTVVVALIFVGTSWILRGDGNISLFILAAYIFVLSVVKCG